MMVSIAGTGSALPETTVTNEELVAFTGQKDAAWIEARLGIRERRLLHPLDAHTGEVREARMTELELAALAAERALDSAGITKEEIGVLWLVTCTQSPHELHFGHAAFALHRRLGLSSETEVHEVDAGCAGALQALHVARSHLTAIGRNGLIVTLNGASQFMSRDLYITAGAWLSLFIFGDGAGALALRSSKRQNDGAGILATYYAVDPSHPLMHFRTLANAKPVYEIEAKEVAAEFPRLSRRAIEGLQLKRPFSLSEIDRFYFHQVNLRVLEAFCQDLAVPWSKVAVNVDRYGNLAAAATPVLLDEDLRGGGVGPGSLCLFCTVGAGAQLAAALIRL